MTPPTANVIRCLRTALGDANGGPDDATLLRRFAQTRDPEAFELLVWRHAGLVLCVCRSRLHDHHAAEDASQAVFLALAKQAAADLAYEPNKPLPKIEGPFANAFHVSMLDGTAFAIEPEHDPKVLRIFIGMDDGLVSPGMKALAARLPVETDADRAELKKLTDRNEKLIAESEQLLKEHIELLRSRRRPPPTSRWSRSRPTACGS